MAIKVFIYDDDSKRRDSLRSLLNLTEEFEVVGEAFNCEQVEKEMNLYKPDVVLMDINMPVVNGIEGLKYIAKNFPEIRVLIQTAYDDDEKIFEAIKNGANGYILKSDSANKILQSIDEVYRGGAAMNPAIAMRILTHFQPQEKKSPLTA